MSMEFKWYFDGIRGGTAIVGMDFPKDLRAFLEDCGAELTYDLKESDTWDDHYKKK
jgi:hypothetical protein